MFQKYSIYALLLIAFIVNPGNGNAQIRPLYKKKHAVNKLLQEVIDAPDFKTAGFALCAIDMESGEIIAQTNPNLVLRPASTFKLLSTATFLELYGPDHRIMTTLELTEKTDSSGKKVPGNIIIRGGGDPTIGSEYFNEGDQEAFLRQWANAITELGIDTLHGGIIGDARIFSKDMVPSAWSWGNMGQYYGAAPSGLSVYDNGFSVYFNTPEKVGEPASISGFTPSVPLVFQNEITADSITYDNAYIYGAPYSWERSLRGTLPLRQENFKVKGSLPDPALAAAILLDSMLRTQGVYLSSAPTTARILEKNNVPFKDKGEIIYTSWSPELKEIITETNTYSINHFAEHCMLLSGMKLGSAPEIDAATDSVLSYWTNKGMDTQGLRIYDGSGLSHYDAISPNQMVWLLRYMKYKSPYFKEFYNSMAVAGRSGTLETLFKESIAEGELRAKSGTISHVKAYAGYVTSVSGRDIAFSMVVNGFSSGSRDARAKLEKLMISLAEFDK